MCVPPRFLPWRLGRFQPWCAPRPPAVVSADRQSSQHGPADLCTAPSAGAKHPAQTPACPWYGGDRHTRSICGHIMTAAHTRNISTMKTNKPCPPSKCVSWPRAPVESCLVHTVDLISPKGAKHNKESEVTLNVIPLLSPKRSAERWHKPWLEQEGDKTKPGRGDAVCFQHCSILILIQLYCSSAAKYEELIVYYSLCLLSKYVNKAHLCEKARRSSSSSMQWEISKGSILSGLKARSGNAHYEQS